MITEITLLLLYELLVNGSLIPESGYTNFNLGASSPDLQISVILPVCIIAILLVVVIVACWYYNKKKDYPLLNGESAPIITQSINQQTSYQSTTSTHDEPVGLQNNTVQCYMNSVIQALSSSKNILKDFNNAKKYIPNSEALKTLLCLLKGVNNDDNNATVEKNTVLLRNLTSIIGWDLQLEQDAFEFMSKIINAIHGDLKNASFGNRPPLKIEMVNQLSGSITQSRVQYFIGLSLGLCGNYETYPGVPLNYLIDKYLTAGKIEDSPNDSFQLVFFKSSPDVLILHIQANKWNAVERIIYKPNYVIQYDEYLELDLNIVLSVNENKKHTERVDYELMAVVEHMGSYSSGHYVTYRKHNQQWYLTNDEQIKKIVFSYKQRPYILIYEKIVSRT